MMENSAESQKEIKTGENEERVYEYTKLWNPFMVYFGGKVIPVAEVEKAIEFMYDRKPIKGRHRVKSFTTMAHRYRFIKKESHYERLRKMKKEGIKCDQNHMRFFIGLEMEMETEKRLAKGENLTNSDYMEMFHRIRKDHKIPESITVTGQWIIRWKKEYFPNEMRYAKFKKDRQEKTEE